MYDLIGDIHGHADELVELLEKLGYQKRHDVYGHPERKVIFLGDFIDRGEQIRQVLEIVRPMIDEGKALAVMGNHELNALAYHTKDPEFPRRCLRRHTRKNKGQHHKTLEQLKSKEQLTAYLDWFRTLPMWLDLDGLRVVHACWDGKEIKKIAQGLKKHGGVTTAFLQSACKEGNALYSPVEIALKGKEVSLPKGVSFPDPDGHARTNIRSRWYLSARGHTYREYALQSKPVACDLKLPKSAIKKAPGYPTTAKPVFFGHYWLLAKRPERLAKNVACLDYSVAKGGFLCAYRWQGEQELDNGNFVWVARKRRNS